MDAGLVNPIFWIGMMIALTAAFIVAFPVNQGGVDRPAVPASGMVMWMVMWGAAAARIRNTCLQTPVLDAPPPAGGTALAQRRTDWFLQASRCR